jgi:acetyl esterase
VRPPNSLLVLTRLAFRLPERALRAFAGETPRADDGTPIDPVLGAMLAMTERAGFPKTYERSVAEAREGALDDAALVSPPPEPMASVEDRFIPGPAGSIRVRVYRPSSTPNAPLLVYLHGGGFVICDLESHDPVCRRIAKVAGCVVVAVHYRLAPEHRFPAAAEDAEAAVAFALSNAESFGGDPTRVGVAGDSAGGNLATVACRRLRDRGAPVPKAQVLIYPATDFTSSMDSHRRYASGFFLEEKSIDWFRNNYVPDVDTWKEPDASPYFAEDVSGLPPAVLVTAGFDPLLDEGKAYADRLHEAGVDVRYRCESALIHGFVNMAGISPACSDALDRIAHDAAELL